MVNRITVTLEQPEYAALLRMATAELRNPSDQLRHILRTELEHRGLWPLPGSEGCGPADKEIGGET